MAYLEVYEAGEAARPLTLGNTMSFGRHTNNEVVLCDGRASRHHARITRHGDGFLLEDLSSSNGTFLRQQRLLPGSSSELVDGDEIRIGTTRLIFHLYRFISSSSEIPRPTAWSQNPPQPFSSAPPQCPKPLMLDRTKPSLSEVLNSPVPMPTFLRPKGKSPSKQSA